MRRLPVFFVLDCSESMIGENLKKMTDGLQMIVGDLRKDPHALETARVAPTAVMSVRLPCAHAENSCALTARMM